VNLLWTSHNPLQPRYVPTQTHVRVYLLVAFTGRGAPLVTVLTGTPMTVEIFSTTTPGASGGFTNPFSPFLGLAHGNLMRSFRTSFVSCSHHPLVTNMAPMPSQRLQCQAHGSNAKPMAPTCAESSEHAGLPLGHYTGIDNTMLIEFTTLHLLAGVLMEGALSGGACAPEVGWGGVGAVCVQGRSTARRYRGTSLIRNRPPP